MIDVLQNREKEDRKQAAAVTASWRFRLSTQEHPKCTAKQHDNCTGLALSFLGFRPKNSSRLIEYVTVLLRSQQPYSEFFHTHVTHDRFQPPSPSLPRLGIPLKLTSYHGCHNCAE